MDDTKVESAVITREDIEAAGAALFCRLGDATAEANRRGRLRDLIDASRKLCGVLDTFAKRAVQPLHGNYTEANLTPEVDALGDAFAIWTRSVADAADVHRQFARACKDSSPAS